MSSIFLRSAFPSSMESSYLFHLQTRLMVAINCSFLWFGARGTLDGATFAVTLCCGTLKFQLMLYILYRQGSPKVEGHLHISDAFCISWSSLNEKISMKSKCFYISFNFRKRITLTRNCLTFASLSLKCGWCIGLIKSLNEVNIFIIFISNYWYWMYILVSIFIICFADPLQIMSAWNLWFIDVSRCLVHSLAPPVL